MNMLSIILHCYETILISVGSFSFILFSIGLYFILKSLFRPSQQTPKHNETKNILATHIISSKDISAISGEDVTATQLDLARAYLETGQLLLAKKILATVVHQGNHQQQKEAQILLATNTLGD